MNLTQRPEVADLRSSVVYEHIRNPRRSRHRRGDVRRRSAVREPATAQRTAHRDREQLRRCGHARRGRLRDARAGADRGERRALPPDPRDRRRTGRIRHEHPRASATPASMRYVDHYEGDPETILDAISAVSGGQPKPVVASVVRSDGQLPPGTARACRTSCSWSRVPPRSRAPRTPRLAVAPARRGPALPRPKRGSGGRTDRFTA